MKGRTLWSDREHSTPNTLQCSFFKKRAHAAVELISNFVWPQFCPICGKIGVSCCEECLRSLAYPLPSFCARCGAPFGSDCCSGPVLCNALTLHEGVSRELLLELKYKNVRSLGVPMGKLLGESFVKTDADILIPIPLHKSSIRNYNQSLLFAQGVSMVWDMPVKDNVLYWRTNIGSQAGKPGILRNMMPVDAMKTSKNLRGVSVVLVDDVYTTGNTMRAAITAVEGSGGTVASVLVWSRRVSSQENESGWKDIVTNY